MLTSYSEVDLSINPKFIRAESYKGLTIELWRYDTLSVAFSILKDGNTLHNNTLSLGSSLDAEYHAMLHIDAM